MGKTPDRIANAWLLQDEGLLFWIVTGLLASIDVRLYAHEGAFRDAFASMFDAIFIAAFLAKVVDPVIKGKLLREGIKDVFVYAYGYRLPQPLLDFFDETLLKARFLRINARLHWTICPAGRNHSAGSDPSLQVKLQCIFEPVNFFNENLSYVHDVYATSDSPEEEATVERLYCKVHATGHYLYPENGSPFSSNSAASENASRHRARRKGSEIPLPADMPLSSGPYECGVVYSSYAPLKNGFDEFRVSELTPRTSVTVTVDNSLKDHVFSILPTPADGIEEKSVTLDPKTGEFRCSWEYHRLMVPNEMIALRWRSPAL